VVRLTNCAASSRFRSGVSVPESRFVVSQGGPRVPADTSVGFRLDVELAVSLPGVPRAEAEAPVAKAHEVYPCSNATRGNVDVRLTVV
jgi:organic hydroperoxide reductase OsmC/OhrA